MKSSARPEGAETDAVVFVVDDDDGMRRGLEFLLASAGYQARAFSSAQAFLDAWRPGTRGCLLLDVRMPGMSGLELQQRLKARRIDLPVILVTAFANVPMAVRAIQAGAFDFIEKPFEGADLLERVRRALMGQRRRREDDQFLQEVCRRRETLTPREREVMDQVIAGQLNKQIAGELGISMKTVEHHRACVMDKMGAQSLAELVRMSLAADGQTSATPRPTPG